MIKCVRYSDTNDKMDQIQMHQMGRIQIIRCRVFFGVENMSMSYDYDND